MKTPFAIVALFAILPALAGQSDFPPVQEAADRFHSLVDTEFVAREAVLPKFMDVAIIDTRPTVDRYDPGHVPTAISIPDAEFARRAILLPRARGTLLIFYGDDADDRRSHDSAFKAERLGYTNVKVYSGGYRDWLASGRTTAISPAFLKKLIDGATPLTLIDTRNRERQYNGGHIPGAISMPYKQFARLTDRLPGDRDATLIFYCDGLECRSSTDAAAKAVALGYRRVMTMPVGYAAWRHLYGDEATTKNSMP